MIHCKELNKDFETKEDLFKEIRLYQNDIISFKKAQIYKSCDKGIGVTAKPIDPLKLGANVKGISIDSDYYYIAVNSTKILDSHQDLHLNGIWNKTANEQQGKVYLVADHALKMDQTIARKEHVEMFVAEIPFALLNKPYDGNTEALVYKVRKDKVINEVAKEWLDSGDAIEASVRMQYVDMLFALNSDDKEDIPFKANYDKYIKEVANIEDFDTEIVYFWPVLQAKNVLESSLVLFGSNSSTGQITEDSKFQPSLDTEIKIVEPSEDTQKQKQINDFYLNLLKEK